ncbi:MAG: type II toxin-antitoxin system Phd/YefM family antitoxin [Caldilineaceae bacterium]|nr:type II toxin-antitoxin system Phd/YefM family antitoxin [Caldilineaceae bacterium]
MKQTVGVTEARNRLGELVDQVRYRGDTVVLMRSGKPVAAIVPFELLEQWQKGRETLFAVVKEVQERNRDLEMSDDELMAVVSEIVHEVRAQS